MSTDSLRLVLRVAGHFNWPEATAVMFSVSCLTSLVLGVTILLVMRRSRP